MPTATPSTSAISCASSTICSVCPIARVMSGQIGCEVSRETPNFCVKTDWTQYQ